MPGHLCGQELGQDHIDGGTNCRAQMLPPGTTGSPAPDSGLTDGALAWASEALETVRQQVVVEVVLGLRKVSSVCTPGLAMIALAHDESAARMLLAQGQYGKAFEVATGFQDYFDIARETRAAPASKTAAVMLGHATGVNQAKAAATGKGRSGELLGTMERIAAAVDALARIATTVMIVSGPVKTASGRVMTGMRSASAGRVKIVSPVFRLAGRDVLIVETSVGRQAFYRSSGSNSGMPGRWLPVDEFWPWNGWFNKAAYTTGEGLQAGQPLHRLGTPEFLGVSQELERARIPPAPMNGVPAGANEGREMTMNRILDFFNARTTGSTVVRPVGE